MPVNRDLRQRWSEQVHHVLDQVLFGLSTYALVIFIGLVSLTALFSWETYYPATGAKQLEFQIAEEVGSALTPAQALALLKGRVAVQHHDTRLSEVPLWFSTNIRTEDVSRPLTLEFPSRHAVELACWDANTLALLGRGNPLGTEGKMSEMKAGFALALDQPSPQTQLLCRASFVGPARLTAVQWFTSELQISAHEFHRNSGLLEGGLIVLALFVLITALINRDRTYILFAVWLVVNLRMGSLSAGWDSQWLGHTIPPGWMLQSRLITIAVYYTVTVTLFITLFRDDLVKVGFPRLLRFTQWTCLPLLLLSVALSYKSFLPIFWVSTGINVTVLVFFLGRILMVTRSPVAMWYSASIGITLFSSFYEVISAAMGYKGMIGAVNSVTAALSSSLLAALAIAAQMRQEHKQRLQAQAELAHTYEAMPIGLFTLDLQGRFLSANPALFEILSANVMAPGRDSWGQYFSKDAFKKLLDQVHDETDVELEIGGVDLLGTTEYKRFLVKATMARNKIEGSLQDITEKSRAIEDLRFMANNDPLTKVLNLRGIQKAIDNAVQQQTDGKPLALAYLDLDRFKLINDLYGHLAGDEVLKQICVRATSKLNSSQKIGRVGGDEFLIVFEDTSMSRASSICREIIDSIGGVPYRIGNKAFQVRASIGLVEVSPDMQIKDVIATADRACRQAKIGHSDGLVAHEKNAAAFRDHQAELDLVARLSVATATDGLFLEMQPIMSLKAPHDSLNFEVLLRLRNDDGSVTQAGPVIAAAEQSGRIGLIDRWVMGTTLAWLDTHDTHLARTQFVCMNLSGASLNDEQFMDDAFAMLARNRHIASRLCIEITESVALHDLGNTRRFIDKVRSYGVKVALDDFGAGYTSFSYLKELPADVIKIDGSFIVNINAHPANLAIVEAIVTLATQLGMKTIAEWAEDNATVETLAEIGIDYVQGYAIARPQSPTSLLAAASSASFITDEELATFVRTLGASAETAAEADPFANMPSRGLH